MKMSRRDFLYSIPAGAALSAVVPLASAAPGPHIGCQTNAWALKPGDFGLFLTVLGTLKSLGFEGFETSFRNAQAQYATAAAARAQTIGSISGVSARSPLARLTEDPLSDRVASPPRHSRELVIGPEGIVWRLLVATERQR